LETALRLEPSNTKALTGKAMVLARTGKQREAIECFRQVVAFDPGSAGAHLNLGIALADGFDLQGALSEFSEAVRLEPNSAAALYNKGRALLDLRRNDEAKRVLDAATRAGEAPGDAWYLLGLIERQSGNDRAAIALFEKALQLQPDNTDALFKLGQELLHTGDQTGAIARWRRVVEINPNYGEALYSLARVLAKSDPDESKRLLARFTELQAQQHVMDRAQTLGNFALASAAAHDWPEAISQLKQALQICGNCRALPLLHKDLGLIYCRSGDLQNGLTELREAQKLTPHDPDITTALEILDGIRK